MNEHLSLLDEVWGFIEQYGYVGQFKEYLEDFGNDPEETIERIENRFENI